VTAAAKNKKGQVVGLTLSSDCVEDKGNLAQTALFTAGLKNPEPSTEKPHGCGQEKRLALKAGMTAF